MKYRYLRLICLIALLVVTPACSSVDSGGPREVRVALTEFSIDASTRTFTPGVPYRLVVANRGQVNHELRIAAPGVQGRPGEILSVDEMTLQPGTAHTVDIAFPESIAGTSLELSCHLPAHYEFGMHLTVAVR
jgi:uncharacterized cupredoxin-like copper-binding protein